MRSECVSNDIRRQKISAHSKIVLPFILFIYHHWERKPIIALLFNLAAAAKVSLYDDGSCDEKFMTWLGQQRGYTKRISSGFGYVAHNADIEDTQKMTLHIHSAVIVLYTTCTDSPHTACVAPYRDMTLRKWRAMRRKQIWRAAEMSEASSERQWCIISYLNKSVYNIGL